MTMNRIKLNCCKIITLLLLSSLLLCGCGPQNTVNSPNDVTGKRIGGLAGTPSVRLASEYGTAIPYESTGQMMTDLRQGVVDCVVMESTTAAELVSKTRGVRILIDPLVKYDLCFAVPKENKRLLRAVDAALETLESNGVLRGLYNKYFGGRNYSYVSPEKEVPFETSLTIALPPDSPPFSYKDSEGRFVGMDVEVAIALGDILEVEIIPLEHDSWELATAVWHGRADLALGWHPAEGEGIINESIPYAEVEQVIIVRR